MPKPLQRILEARAAVEKTEGELARRRRAYFRAIAEAHEAGESYSAIGRALGVSRQRAARMVAEERRLGE